MCGCMLYTSPTTDRQGEASVGEDPRERGQYESEVHRSGGAQSHQRTDKETDRQFFGRLAQESIAAYNIREGTSFEFVEVEKANLYRNKGYIYFITFVAKDLCDQTKVFQAKVCNVFCREIEHSFCRLKPGQQECKEDSKRVVKKPRYNTRSNKRACRCH
ncbi:uncharacterized protein LOC125584196 isoform X2 [Brassica napus]|uniref:uncharacterized protein LOC125584196 isoform X2 n=1 Tax=Brassica napus TaxID=3708 RepID=UPI00207AFC79|nr:uncharacterized protein LOC125584196 isoform X2 [Brassica napus]